MAGAVDLGLVGLHMRDVFLVEPFTVSKKWSALGGASLPGSIRLPGTRASRIQ